MKAIIVYDENGTIISIIYSVDGSDAPKGVPCIIVDLPVGSTVTGLDMSTKPPSPIYTYWPAVDMEGVRASVKDIGDREAENLKGIEKNAEGISQNTTDIDIVELALAELYESGVAGVSAIATAVNLMSAEPKAKRYSAIVQLYARLVEKGLKRVEDIPESIRKDVEELLGMKD